MLKDTQIKTFKKINKGDVMGVIRTMYPNIEVETVLEKNRRKKKNA